MLAHPPVVIAAAYKVLENTSALITALVPKQGVRRWATTRFEVEFDPDLLCHESRQIIIHAALGGKKKRERGKDSR